MGLNSTCLATVTSDGFVPGTLVMLHSFKRHNPEFRGDIVIIHDGLASEQRAIIERCIEDVQFLQVSAETKARAAEITTRRTDLAAREARFYSLELFRLRGYRKLLFVDSDVLFRGPVTELLQREEALLCCGEALYYSGGARRPGSLEAVDDPTSSKDALLQNTFNTGFLVIDGSLLRDQHQAGLMALLDAERFQTIRARITDQAIFNLHFAGMQTLLSATYNYLLPYPGLIANKEKIALSEAKVLHYCSAAKPWDATRMLHSAIENPRMIKALQFWNDAFVEMLQHLHLRSRAAIETRSGTASQPSEDSLP